MFNLLKNSDYNYSPYMYIACLFCVKAFNCGLADLCCESNM